jgi:DNA-binding transcriptional MerR regulator
MNTRTDQLTIQQVAETTGLTVHTLRYYERIGLIHPVNRADNTHRRYSTDDIGWIQFLMKLRATGMSIQEMQLYAELQRQGDETLRERVEMLRALQHRVEAHIEELNVNRRLICSKIEFYEQVIEQRTPEMS